ncbi:YCF48-related protein [Methylibium sp.]|uniref:YCF48-related protein n=1 Tax=Methylibium sp. TaxID=2067992 RepID=UPI003340F8E1
MLIAIARAGGRLVAVGDAGTVILSDDGGARWSQAKVPVGVSLTSVHFVDAQTGWAVGHSGVILATTDGGASWRKQLDGFQARGIEVEPPLGGHGVPAAAGGEGDPLLDVHFEDARRGFAVGAFGRLLCTTDGGQHWRHCEGRLDNPDGNHLYAIRPAGGALVVVGERGSVYVSRDQGASFERVATPYEGSFFGVHGVPDGRLLVYGLRGHVFASADQGRSWTDLSPAAASSAVTGAATLDDGRVALVSQDGSVFVGGRPGEPLGRLPERGPSLSAAAASPGGALVAVGPRGIVVLPKPAAPPATSASASAS